MIRVNLFTKKLERDGLMSKELLLHCSREEVSGLQEQVLKVMVELGLRIKVVPIKPQDFLVFGKQATLWEAYNQDNTLAMKYLKRYDSGKYVLQVDIHNLAEHKLKNFYEGWKTI